MMNENKQKKVFYGWIMVFCCTCMIMGSSMHSAGMSTNLAAIRESYGFSGTQVSLILTFRSLISVLAAMAATKYFAKTGLKFGMVLSMLFGAAAFGLFFIAKGHIWIYYVGGAVAGLCYAYGFILPASLLLKRWFNQSLGTAISLAGCGTGITNLVLTPIIQLIIDRRGLGEALLLQAMVLVAISLLLLKFVVEKPEDVQLEPYGGNKSKKEIGKIRGHVGLSGQWVVAIFIALTLIGMSSSPATAHYTVNFTDVGIRAMSVAKALSIFGLTGIVSRVIYGKILDRIGATKSTILFGILLITGFLCCFAIKWFPSVKLMYFALIIAAAGTVTQILGYPNWVADLDPKNYERTMKRCQTGYQLGALIGSPLPGIIKDLLGSYCWSYVLFAVDMVVALAIIIIAYRKLRLD